MDVHEKALLVKAGLGVSLLEKAGVLRGAIRHVDDVRAL